MLRNGECELHGDAAEDAEGADEQSGHPAPGPSYHVFKNHVWDRLPMQRCIFLQKSIFFHEPQKWPCTGIQGHLVPG